MRHEDNRYFTLRDDMCIQCFVKDDSWQGYIVGWVRNIFNRKEAIYTAQ
jgi:hypothetical protein